MSLKKISFLALFLLIVSAVDSNRNLPAAAIFGSPLIFFFLFSAVFFLFPSSLVSAELSAAFPDKGGIYHWVRVAYGEKTGMCAIWLQWITTMVWYPTILSFLAGTGAYLFDPSLIDNKLYMVVCIAAIFWTLTVINLLGIHISARVNGIFCALGTVFPMFLLIGLGFYWIFSGEPSAISFEPSLIFGSLEKWDTWTALEGVMVSFLGMELSGVHVSHIENPQRNFPRAILLACLFILTTMLLGSLMIAIVLPSGQINLAGGLMQVFAAFFEKFHLQKLIFGLSLLIVIGSIGGIINWIISPAKGLLHASESGYLPAYFCHVNSRGVASRILVAQAVLVTLFCSVFLLLPSVNAFYWFLTGLSNCLYMLMYILMFLSALRLRSRQPSAAFRIPMGYVGLGFCCVFGLIGSILTIVFGFVPPPNIDIGSPMRYTIMIAIGNILALLPLFWFFSQKKKRSTG